MDKVQAEQIVDVWFQKNFGASAGSWGDHYTLIRERVQELRETLANAAGAPSTAPGKAKE